MKHIITGLLLMLMSAVGWGDIKNQGYSCVILASYLLDDDGSFLGREHRIGRTFTIDRGTGRAIGAIKNHSITAYGNFQPTVIDRGSDEQYFKALTVYGSNNPSIDVLVVKEFADGIKKAFMFNHNGEVDTGTCENI